MLILDTDITQCICVILPQNPVVFQHSSCHYIALEQNTSPPLPSEIRTQKEDRIIIQCHLIMSLLSFAQSYKLVQTVLTSRSSVCLPAFV